MNAPPTNERFQFSIRSLLIYTFGMAALVSLLVCNVPETVFPAWFLLGLFFYVRGDKGSIKILGSAIVWFVLLIFLGYPGDVKELFILSCKVSGVVSFTAYHFCLFIR